MKKITLLLLVATLSLTTTAQRKSKKIDRKSSSSKMINASDARFEYMVIKGIEVPMNRQFKNNEEPQKVERNDRAIKYSEDEMNRMLKSEAKLRVFFEYGRINDKEFGDLMRASQSFSTMSDAANAAANIGWEYMNSNILLEGRMKIHYYYMRRDKRR